MSDCSAPKWRLRWLRFSVRGLIALTLLVGIALGLVVRSARRQREVVAAIQACGGSVTYDWEVKNGWYSPDQQPRAPRWLVQHLGVDYFGHPIWVRFSIWGQHSRIDLRLVGCLAGLEQLALDGTLVDDADLAHIQGLRALTRFNIGDISMNCSGIDNPAGASGITDAGLASLKGFARLDILVLRGARVAGAGLVNLAGMTRLEQLDLGDTQLNDAGLANLKTLVNLLSLRVTRTRITDAGLVHLKRMTRLRWLDLSDTAITDAGLTHLKGLIKLTEVDLSGTPVSRAGVTALDDALPNTRFRIGPKSDALPDTVDQLGTNPAPDVPPERTVAHPGP
jgi:hypothetical protein